MLSLKGSTCTVCYCLLMNFISPQILCVYLVDEFVVENFAQGGCLVVISWVYPIVAIGNLANLYLFNNGTTPITIRSITTWHMSQVIMTPY